MGGGDGGLAMLTTQPLHSTGAVGNTTNSSSGAFVKSEDATENQFPAGLRVLVVDDDPICLMMLDTLLRRCLYKVTTCGQATKALSMLRENRDNFDLVISDVCMPDMDGFKLLELVGLEMDLPVIMMSANGETSAVMKGITHGACDYLLKPVRIEELRNIWQHVVRKKRKEVHENKPYGSADHEPPKQGVDDGERLSPPYDSCDGRLTKKRKEIKEDDDENEDENDDPSTTKKPRVVWSVELHQQFVNAVNHLGIDKAVPKRILELMNMQGLTRENVASHLQKYRLYLKRLSGVPNQQLGMNLAFGGILDPSFSPLTKLDGLGDLKALVAAGQLPSHTLASLQTGILNRLNMPSNVGMGSLNSPGISLMSLQGINGTTLGRPQVAPHSLTNQGGLLPSIPSVGSGQFSKSQQITDAGQLSTPIEDIVQMNVLQQQLAGASGLGSSGHAGGMIHGSFPMNSSNNTFQTQLLQHQQQQIRSPGLANLPTGLLGQCLISSENSLIGGNESLGGGMLAKGPCISTTANISGSFTRMPNSKSLNLPTATHCSFTTPSSVGVSSASLPAGCSFSSTMLKDVTAFTGRDASKSHGGFSDQVDSLGLRGSLGKPPVLIDNMDLGFTHELNQNTRQSWQAKQVCSPTLSSRFGQVPLCQNLSSGLGQSQVVHSQQLNLQPRSPNDQIPIMPHAQCNNEQTAAENSLRLRDQPLPDTLSGTKIEGGLASKHSPSADDLLNIFFRQHQEGTSFAGDLTSDGYSLQNMYMM